MDLRQALAQYIDAERILADEPMSEHITFHVGGPADWFISIASVDELRHALRICKDMGIPTLVMGNGSNLLVRDGGIRGAVLQLYEHFRSITVNGRQITAQAGAMLSAVARKACDAGLSGLSFASGIPGTVGGAVVMNAGAYGGEMAQVVHSVRVLDGGEVRDVPCDAMAYAYRRSRAMDSHWIVLETTFELRPGLCEGITEEMRTLSLKRQEKQPLTYPSAGSTFKRPEGHFAAKLIDDAGLRGYSIGGAQVAQKHTGFIINTGNATAADILALIGHVKTKVKECAGVDLELEVHVVGEDV